MFRTLNIVIVYIKVAMSWNTYNQNELELVM